jgi:hypothetical protein
LAGFCFALRTFRKSPAFTLVALATLALGIGVNTAMYSVANAVLWRSLPFPDVNKIVWVGEVERANQDTAWGASYLNFLDWQARSHSFECLAAILRDDRILRQRAEPARVAGLAVTREFFEILGVQPAAGRFFSASDEKPGAAPVIVLSDRMWRRRFGGDPAMLGRAIPFDDATVTVVGIMPERFDTLLESDYWLPLGQVPAGLADESSRCAMRRERGCHLLAAECHGGHAKDRACQSNPRLCRHLEREDSHVGRAGGSGNPSGFSRCHPNPPEVREDL